MIVDLGSTLINVENILFVSKQVIVNSQEQIYVLNFYMKDMDNSESIWFETLEGLESAYKKLRSL